MRKIQKIAIKCMALVGALSMGAGALMQSFNWADKEELSVSAQSNLKKTDALIDTDVEQFFDESVVQKLPTAVSKNEDISVIVQLSEESIMDSFKKQSAVKTVSEYATSREAKKLSSQIERKQQGWINRLDKSGIKYTLGERYDTVMNGFEIVIKANDFEKAAEFFANDAKLIVGDVYEVAQAEPIHNYVDVYDTGIFNTSSSTYQGDGVVVAVLDTGLDYTHTAFSVDNFSTELEAFTPATVSQKVGQTVAAEFTEGLTGEDVYVSKKVPYAYDYADKDPDVLPINSDHGTHVAGIIAGNDDEITGVAPNAQLAIMKVFSDAQQGAKDSWILAALEDCVTLGVDVINMSLGSNCGFSREVDKKNTAEIYDSIREAGISLIAAAGNDHNAAMGSEKNGNNPLTSNPDSGPVGAPSTYEASLSVASVDGVKTPYLRYQDELFYFKEATAADAKPRHFVDEILEPLGVDSHEFEYVTIPGIGRSSDYPEEKEFYKGKIVLVKRGQTTFEDKVRVAIIEKGAAGIIIYNNVSGDISMSIGESTGAVCSIAQEIGEKLAAAGTGILKISKGQVAGPFMSDFSSWGPTSDLKIKPEITAHGGEIYSAIPGQAYDRISGTSMAAPNQAGAAALIRQYVKYENVFGTVEEMEADPVRVTTLVNQLMMSTADIVLNKNGLPYAVRKQGAGLVNIADAYSTASYVSTFQKTEGTDGEVTLKEMDKTKLELGDDKDRTGEYEMTFAINNVSANTVTYELGSIIQTEGVSSIYTSHSDTTVTQEGYLLKGTQLNIISVTGGQCDGMNVTVGSKQSATITAKLVLSADDKAYLEESFQYGMYVEGYITMKGVAGTEVDMNVPVLAFYGDWTEAPIFDEEYYDTHKDEINAGLDPEDKLMPDAYATRVIGGLYSDYISTLGTYYFIQDPSATQIAADKDKIALSNQERGNSSTLNSIYAIWAGLLRNVKEWTLTIVEDATGELIYTKTEYNQPKSSSSGASIYQSSFKVDFSVLEHNLKNNTKYTVKVETFIDYGTKAEQNNARNTFEFPLYIDFEAPVVTDVAYRTEYDKTTKKTSLFADISVYDNHYAMGLQLGQIVPENNPDTAYIYSMESFGKYMTPIYSSYNSTSKVTVELTDYVQKIKQSCGPVTDRPNDGDIDDVVYNNNSFIINCYDYAMNSATYEVRLPDEIISMYFDIEGEELRLSPHETKDLATILKVFPEESWMQTLDFTTDDSSIVDIVNQTVIAKKSGEATITAIGYNKKGEKVSADLKIKVLAEGDEGYNGSYTIPEINKFALTGYYTNKAYYAVNSVDREIGLTGSTQSFGNSATLSMFPSESVTLKYDLDSYFADRTDVTYTVGNSKIATVSEDGTIIAQSEGSTIVSVDVTFDGQSTFYSARVMVTVKDPYTTNSIYLMSYKGLGGEVIIPADRGFTTIYAYAFSNYEYVEKNLKEGDVIDDEDPYHIKQKYIGENTITKVVIPEGVTHINEYAFANLTALEEVVLPESLINIGVGAFYNCTKLKKINLEKVKFINESAFENCALEEIELDSINAIGNESFKNCKLNYVELPKSSQSLGIGAFANNKYLMSVTFQASKMKIGSSAFDGCTKLTSIKINAAVIASDAFKGCTALKEVALGKDVAVIGEYAFADTAVEKFSFITTNDKFELKNGGTYLYKKGTTELVLAAPAYAGEFIDGKTNVVSLPDTTAIGKGAFSGNKRIFRVIADKVTDVGAYAFAGCERLEFVSMNSLVNVDDYAFAETGIKATPNLAKVEMIGDYAFATTKIESVDIESGVTIGAYAFAYNTSMKRVTIGDNVTIGDSAFYCTVKDLTFEETGSLQHYTWYAYKVLDEEGNVVDTYDYYSYNYSDSASSMLTELAIGANVIIGEQAFYGHIKLNAINLGDNAVIGDYAFFNVVSLTSVDLSKAQKIGAYAFSGASTPDIWLYEDDRKTYAYELKMMNGELTAIDYMYSTFAPAFAHVDVSAATAIGIGAFANNNALNSVVIGENIGELTVVDGNEVVTQGKVPAGMFMQCKSLKNIVLPATVITIGDSAFYRSSLESVNLENVSNVGTGAFTSSALREVTLNEGGTIGEGAFAYCENLAKVTGLDGVNLIGASAFAGTALTEAKLTNVTEIGDFAFGSTGLTKVEFGDKLVKLGENPFYATKISSYAKETNGFTENYEIGESKTVKVIDGVLYQVLPSGGLELVSYPTMREASSYKVLEGTVRIGAKAFMETKLRSVTLASTLVALGDKAFYGCENLSTVIFLGYVAPLLEEEYDTTYLTYNNLPQTGYLGEYKGLGIAPYYMWSVTANFSNFYFGANFVDHIGHIEDKLVMVRPANGQYYETFIMSQYFGTVADGSVAPTEATRKVIEMIAALPDASDVTLADKDVIRAARAAYNNLPDEGQKWLVDTSRLDAAEMILNSYIGGDTPPTPPVVEEKEVVKETTPTWAIVLLIVESVLLLGCAGVAGFFLSKKFCKKSATAEETAEENTENSEE